MSDYRKIVGDEVIGRIYREAGRLCGKHILEVNSTSRGGGVAEMLKSAISLMNETGVEVGWRTLVSDPDFFRVTKQFHNALQGGGMDLTRKKMKVYEETNATFSQYTHVNHDLVVIHDPQPLALIEFYGKRQPWVWRCHIDLSDPSEEVWKYLKPFVLKYDRVVYQTREFATHDTTGDFTVISPAIDPLSMKNRKFDDGVIERYVRKTGVDPEKPVISQVSRFDRYKDPLGVIDVFDRVREEVPDCQLIMAGSFASDDPEGQETYDEVRRKASEKDDVYLITNARDILVNAIQSASDVVLQMSTREGFGLTVAEAMWKKTPVVASRTGGIVKQIEDGENGYLLDPGDYEGFAEKIVELLSDAHLREKMGIRGREEAKGRFLITRYIRDRIDLWKEMLL